VPIGACIVKDGKIIASGYNTREKTQNALHHAEIIAINRACKKLGSWRLDDCEMFVTLQPCPMCAGAIIASRIKTVYFFAPDDTDPHLCEDILSSTRLNHKTALVHLSEFQKPAQDLLQSFFKSARKK